MNKTICFLLVVALCGCQSAQQHWRQTFSSGASANSLLADGAHGEIQHQLAEDDSANSVADQQSDALPLSVSEDLSAAMDEPQADVFSSVSFQQSSDGDSDDAVEDAMSGTDMQAVPLNYSSSPMEAIPLDAATIQLTDVVTSVHDSYPLVFAAFQERAIADGNQVSAWGSFDTKLKASSESGPLGFYENYRNSAGLTKPIYSGGEFFAGYRLGDGELQPWYKERETDEGGEFKAGLRIPLGRDRDIDGRRADLWRATYDRQIADPVIRMQLVMFAREASLAYWKWVAAGEKYKLGLRWVALAEDRNQRIIDQEQLGQLAIADVRANEAAIAKRRAKLEKAANDVRQATIKLSLYFRDAAGNPLLPQEGQSPGFPALRGTSEMGFATDVPSAQAVRPELQALSLEIRRLQVDFAEAVNMTRAGLDAQLVGSQDVGKAASSKRDKSQFELEAGLFFDVPLERRKGRGKMYATQAKIAAVNAKRRIVQDKVTAEVQAVYAALEQTRKQAERLTESVDGFNFVADNERILFDAGQSDLLKVVLQEQYALEAAEEQITAIYDHFVAFTEYAAVLAIDRPTVDLLPAVVEPDPVADPADQ